MFLAIVLALFRSPIAALVVQSLLGAITAALVAAIARRLGGERTGWFAGIAYAIYGPVVFVETTMLAEGLLLFLLVVGLWALSFESATFGRAAMAGAALGAATVVRPTAGVIAAACLLWLIRRRSAADLGERSNKRKSAERSATAFAGGRRWIAFVAAFAIVLLPVLTKSGSLSPQGYGGLNVYIGNSPLHDGRATFRLGAGWDALNSEARRSGLTDPAAQDRYYLAKTAHEIAQHPGAFTALLGRKTLWTLQAEESRDSHSYYFFAGESPLLRILPRWIVLFPLALAGGAVLARRRRAEDASEIRSLLLLYALAAAAAVVFLVVGLRYRMPLVPVLAIAAGFGIDAVAGAAAAGRARELGMYAAAIGAAAAISLLLNDPRNRNIAEEWAFTGSSLVTERRLDEAEAAYRRAIELDPESGLAWDGLGLTLYNANRLADARAALDRAVALDRDNARAAFHLALLDDREGKPRQAAAGYQRALDLSPDDAEVAGHLAGARRKLAVELGMSGRTREARDELRRAVALAPSNGEAWLDLCLLSLDLHEVDAAADALQRARANGAAPERVSFAAEALSRALKNKS